MASVESSQLVWGPYRPSVRQWRRERERERHSCQVREWFFHKVWSRGGRRWYGDAALILLLPGEGGGVRGEGLVQTESDQRPQHLLPHRSCFSSLAFSISFDTVVSFADSSLRSPACCGRPLPKSTPLLRPLCLSPSFTVSAPGQWLSSVWTWTAFK